MSDFERDLKESLGNNGHYDPSLGQRLKKKSRDSFGRRLLWVELTAMVAMVALLIIALFELQMFILATDVKQMILFAIVFLLVMEGINLMKLWYWVVNTKLNVLREVKLLRLEIRDLKAAETLPDGTTQGDFLDADQVVGAGLPNWARWVYKLALFGILAFFLFRNNGIVDNAMLASSLAPYVGEQRDVWIPTYDTQVVVHSDILLTKWPENPTHIPVILPYTNGEILAASLDGEKVAMDGTGPGRYDLHWSEPKAHRGERRIQVDWSFPFSDLPKSDEGGWRTKLQTLLPTTSYWLTVSIEERSGLEPISERAKDNGGRIDPFRATGSPKVEYGSCGLKFRKKTP